MDKEPKNYLVIFQLSALEDDLIVRLKQHVPIILEILKRISLHGTEPLMAFRSKDSGTFGYFVRSTLPGGLILAQIESPGPNEPRSIFADDPKPKKPALPSPTQTRDRLFIVEVGADFRHIRYEGLVNWFLKSRR